MTSLSKCESGTSCSSDYCLSIINPVLYKVHEHLLAKHLNAFAEENDLFPSPQFGFRKGLGTCDALLTIINVIQNALDSG